MFDSTQELAENKLLLLYIFDQLQLPISNTLVTEIVLENNLMNYFQLQQYLAELVDSGFLELNRQDKKQLYLLNPKGKDVLEFFHNRISEPKKNVIDNYLETHGKLIKREVEITADYIPANEDGYIVTCSALQNNETLIELKIRTSSNEQAKGVCSRWKSDPYQIYGKIMNMLTE